MIKWSFFLLAFFLTASAFSAGATLIHCDHEPSASEPCTPAGSLPLIGLTAVPAISFSGDSIIREEKRLYHILSGEQVGMSKTIEFKLYDISGDVPVFKDQSVLNPGYDWYSCWVTFTYYQPGKYIMKAYLDGQLTAEDSFSLLPP